MLRISSVENRNEFRLILEGELVAPWANQLRPACEQARASLHGREFVLEIKNLTAINQAGENVLLGLMKQGVRFRGCGVYTKHLLRQLARRVNWQIEDCRE